MCSLFVAIILLGTSGKTHQSTLVVHSQGNSGRREGITICNRQRSLVQAFNRLRGWNEQLSTSIVGIELRHLGNRVRGGRVRGLFVDDDLLRRSMRFSRSIGASIVRSMIFRFLRSFWPVF